MKIRRAFRMPNPRGGSYSSMEFAVEIDTAELGIEVNNDNLEEVFKKLSIRAEEMLRADIRRYIEEGKK